MKKMITIIGGSEASSTEFEFAYQLGNLLAETDYGIVCGGRSGVMEAACKGSSEAGGFSIGILPGENKLDANPYISLAIPTGMGTSRNRIVILSGEVVCAIGGSYGTLSEIAFALQSGKSVCCFGNWNSIPGVHLVSTPLEAMGFILEKMEDLDA